MCFKKNQNDFQKKAVCLLQEYVSSVFPRLNQLLRNGTVSDDINLFDSLFRKNRLPQYLFRIFPKENLIKANDILTDKAYLSCTTDAGNFIGKVERPEIVCLRIHTNPEVLSINVNEILPNANDEGEYILYRDLRLKILNNGIKDYDQTMFNTFIQDIDNDNMTANELTDIYQCTNITLIEVEIL